MPCSADLEAVSAPSGTSRLWFAGAPLAAWRKTIPEIACEDTWPLPAAGMLRLTNFTEHSAISKLRIAGAANQRREYLNMWEKMLTPEVPADKFGAGQEGICRHRSGTLLADVLRCWGHTRCRDCLQPL
jgi:hypothetical protein